MNERGTAPASADLVLYNGTVAKSFFAVGAQGFGNFPCVLTLHDNGNEIGGVSPCSGGVGCDNGTRVSAEAIAGQNKASTPTLFQAGWGTGAQVGIAFNVAENNPPFTLNSLTLSIYDSSNNS